MFALTSFQVNATHLIAKKTLREEIISDAQLHGSIILEITYWRTSGNSVFKVANYAYIGLVCCNYWEAKTLF